MLIGGLQKTTLLDYPDHVACIVFTQGCNFRCGFCHNPELISNSKDALQCVSTLPEEEFFAFLEKRKKVLDGVVITGGEPCLQKDLKDFIIKIREKGLLVKLDTNGAFPDKLKELIKEKLIDYVAMDVKTVPEKYFDIVAVKGLEQAVKKSIEILLKGDVDYEFRTTVVAGLHTQEDLVNIGKLIKGAPRYFLQKFVSAPKLLDQTFKNKKSLPDAELEKVTNICRQYTKRCEVR